MTLEEALAKNTKLEGDLRVKELELQAKDRKLEEQRLAHEAELTAEKKALSDLQATHDLLLKETVDADVEDTLKAYAKSAKNPLGLSESQKPALKELRLRGRDGFFSLYPRLAPTTQTVGAKAGQNPRNVVNPAQENYLFNDLTRQPRQAPGANEGPGGEVVDSLPATEESARWTGWSPTLKPANVRAENANRRKFFIRSV